MGNWTNIEFRLQHENRKYIDNSKLAQRQGIKQHQFRLNQIQPMKRVMKE